MHIEKGRDAAVNEAYLFHPVFLGGHFGSLFESKYIRPVMDDRQLQLLAIRGKTDRQKKMLTLMRHLSAQDTMKYREFLIRNTVSELWLLLMDEIADTERTGVKKSVEEQDRIMTMMTYIRSHFQEKLTLEEIGSAASVSSRECIRCFKKSIHQTPVEYLTGYRIHTAEQLLRNTDFSVREVAMRTGFSDTAYFGKVFRENTGMTPLAFHRRYRHQK
jgi:transcriptional regulator GlxA family with amidase domain